MDSSVPDLEFTYHRVAVFAEWCDHLQEAQADDKDEQCRSLNYLSELCEEARDIFFQTPGSSLEISQNYGNLAERYSFILGDYLFRFCDIATQLYKSRNELYQMAAIRFITSCVLSTPVAAEIRDDTDRLLEMLRSDNVALSTYASSLAFLVAERDRSFLDTIVGDQAVLSRLVDNLSAAYRYIVDNSTNLTHRVHPKELPRPSDSEPYTGVREGPIGEWGAGEWDWVAQSTLSLLACVADVLDILAFLLSHSITSKAMELVRIGCTPAAPGEYAATCISPCLVMSGTHLLEKAMAHRKLALEVIEQQGLDLLQHLSCCPCSSLVDGAISGCLFTLASHSQAMEKVIRRRRQELSLCISLALSLLRSGVGFRARENAVCFLVEALSYRPSVSLFCEGDGPRLLFHLLRQCVFYVPSDDQSDVADSDGEQSGRTVPTSSNLNGNLPSTHPPPSTCSISGNKTNIDIGFLKSVGGDRIMELRDDLLRCLLVYSRVCAFMDLEQCSPESVSVMCGGGVAAGPTFPVAISVSDIAHGDPGVTPAMHPSQYTAITFDDEGTCVGSAEALLHAMRSYMIEYNDLTGGVVEAGEDLVGVSDVRSTHGEVGDFGTPSFLSTQRPMNLLWCTPVRLNRPNAPDKGGGRRRGRTSAVADLLRQVLREGHLFLILYILRVESTLPHGSSDCMILLLHTLELLSLNPTVLEQMSVTTQVETDTGLVVSNPTSWSEDVNGGVVSYDHVDSRPAATSQDDPQGTSAYESINGIGILLDVSCRLPKRDPLVIAHALHALRALVTPPEYLLLPPYLSPEDVERISRTSYPLPSTQTPARLGRTHTTSAGDVTGNRTTHVDDICARTGGETGFTPAGRVRFYRSPDIASTTQVTATIEGGQIEGRCPSPSSTASVYRASTAQLIERAQRIARAVTRKCNGIHILAAALDVSTITQYVYNIRLALIQILLGLAQDMHIRALLTRLSLVRQLSSLCPPVISIHEAWNSPGAKCLKRVFASTRLCTPKLISLLAEASKHTPASWSSTRSNLTASEALIILMKQSDSVADRGSDTQIENAMIASKTQIKFSRRELLDLVEQFLDEEGLYESAAVLKREAGLTGDPGLEARHGVTDCNTGTGARSVSSVHPIAGRPKRGRDEPSPVGAVYEVTHATSSPTPGSDQTGITGGHTDATGVPLKLQKISAVAESESGQSLKRPVARKLTSPRIRPRTPSIGSSNHSRAYTFREILRAPSYFSRSPCPSELHSDGVGIKKRMSFGSPVQQRSRTRAGSGSSWSYNRVFDNSRAIRKRDFSESRDRRSIGPTVDGGHAGGVSLCGIITSYLRHQHQQCQHPVSIVPNFSLFSRHKCPAPPPSSVSLCDVLFQRMLYGDKRHRGRSYGEADINRVDVTRILKHRVFSEYRQWRVFGETPDDHVSAAAFSADSRKVWVGGSTPHDDDGDRGGSLRLFDMYTSQELGMWEFEHSIDAVVAPPSVDSQLIMTCSGSGQVVDFTPIVNYRTDIWRTSVHSQGVTDYYVDCDAPLVSWEGICKPIFSPSMRTVCGMPSAQPEYVSRPHATLFDVESGREVLSFNSNMRSDMYGAPPYRHSNACFGLGMGGENIVLADGILWDTRTGAVVSQFDRLSYAGHGVFHPNGNCLLIDNVVWDMRRFTLLETIKMLENCETHFSTDGGSVLFGYSPYSLDLMVTDDGPDVNHSVFHAFDATNFSHIHTQEVESDGVLFWGPIQSDPCGLGYLLTVEVGFAGAVRDAYEIADSCCRVLEVGRKKPAYQDNDADDAQTEDEEWAEDDEGDEDDESGLEDAVMVLDSGDDEDDGENREVGGSDGEVFSPIVGDEDFEDSEESDLDYDYSEDSGNESGSEDSELIDE